MMTSAVMSSHSADDIIGRCRYSRRLLMSNVEQEADTSKRNSEECDVVLKESADGLAMMTSSVTRYSRRLLMSNVEQEADTSKRNSEECDVVLKESADGLAMMTSSVTRGKSSRKHLKPTTGQPAASISLPPAGQPDASNSTSSRELQ
ncbi:zinc finger CCCH domain-containing protein 34 [Dorcoceras hygrometricum]|uniref:Zinc finger CCCH domain-containing protein 34 n=1 Tax=Dorcoceras hygrometricum TaxID=472368 RepID=A0A2Z7AF29_9LAMI|nr:zinc finger CCCH domain-containing protein 34 [Dorcoceras hygrometricum]